MKLRTDRRVITGLDLFCGAGGCTAGYVRAAEKAGVMLIMVGIDRKPQPRYALSGGMGFIQADVFSYLSNRTFMRQFDFIAGSPPCQIFTSLKHLHSATGNDDLLTPMRPWMQIYNDVPWIIENVERCSIMREDILLCGSMFEGLTGFDERRQLRRHRKFEISGFNVPRMNCRHNGIRPLGVYGTANSPVPKGGDVAKNLAEGSKLMGIDWMKWPELKEAIPPAYTEYIGDYLIKELVA